MTKGSEKYVLHPDQSCANLTVSGIKSVNKASKIQSGWQSGRHQILTTIKSINKGSSDFFIGHKVSQPSIDSELK